MITGDKYRITVLTDRLIRLEYSENGKFEDRKSFAVQNRDFPEVDLEVTDDGNGLIVETASLKLTYDKKVFSSLGLIIELKETGVKWNYGMAHDDYSNLWGTARTLDEADGPIALGKGIFGKTGYAVLDDSTSQVFDGDEIVNREEEAVDVYFFGYGKDYYAGLRDFYRLCGSTPMIPRYALGNWWSRYYRYTEELYMKVLENFRKEEIPLSVAVIDMDWHITNVDPKYGSGWTGYSWDKALFPDYKRFLKSLHDNNLAVTLNLHPADGIRAFEDMYEDMAKEMGVDPETEEPIEFDFEDPKFREAYFKTVMNPYENDGVDFWWIDWQQGTGKKKDAVDPLILLNHYHYRDQEKRNIRPMIFSRYAGPGSHRYPIGFSGDSITSWRSLAFQPFFTSTASNIGYGWWSHDIGGHMLGDKDNERLIRWIQYGVFSPIMRIHSSSSPFFNKEPWTLPQPYRDVVKKFMKLRHALIPYLYTETHRASVDGRPLIRPMYYDCAENPESYRVGTQYRFGENLIAMAVTEPGDKELQMASTRGIIPKGRWMDIFNGRVYEGEKVRKFYRELSEMPVLIPSGGIVPMSLEDTANGSANPKAIRILVGGGADGEYELYEDDGVSMNYVDGAFVKTKLSVKYDSEARTIEFTIGASQGDLSLIPGERSYVIEFYGIEGEVEDDSATVLCNMNDEMNDFEQGGSSDDSAAGLRHTCNAEFVEAGNTLTLWLPAKSVTESQKAILKNVTLKQNDYRKLVFEIIDRAWIATLDKEAVYERLQSMDKEEFAAWVRGAEIAEKLKDAIEEVL